MYFGYRGKEILKNQSITMSNFIKSMQAFSRKNVTDRLCYFRISVWICNTDFIYFLSLQMVINCYNAFFVSASKQGSNNKLINSDISIDMLANLILYLGMHNYYCKYIIAIKL